MAIAPDRLLATLFLVAGVASLAAAPGSARAAESYDNCTGFIDSLPATVTTQGVWCLRKHLSTNITSGNAITVGANNITIDCNDFKVGGLAAGDTSNAYGIVVGEKQNATVRNCSVRGFRAGIRMTNGAGHLVEDNHLDNNLENGIFVTGENNLVQRNRVYDTGGYPGTTYGINVNADVIDNIVAGVFSPALARGIFVRDAHVIRGNRVRGLQGASGVEGIRLYSPGSTVEGNHLVAPASGNRSGILGHSDGTACRNNVMVNFNTTMTNCVSTGGNVSL